MIYEAQKVESFNKLKQLSEENGFELKEKKWLGALIKHRFLHTESGKVYEGVPHNLFRKGFPKDLRSDLDHFNRLEQLADENGFELKEKEWLGASTKHRFLHTESNIEFKWKPAQLFRKGFPKDLRSDLDRFNQLKQLADENGFELKETEWLGIKTKHNFLHTESDIVYEWKPDQLFSQGFPKDLRSDLDRFNQLKKLADENGFELKETEWLGNSTKHRFFHNESNKEYEWTPSQLFRRGFPMTEGQRYLTQEVCRQAFVHIFGGEFKTNRDRLAIINGSPMELDGYEDFPSVPGPLQKITGYSDADGAEVAFNLPIAFEFQGHQNHRDRVETIERDKLKAKYCKEEGILLVQIEPDNKTFWNQIRDSEFMYDYICKSIQQAVGSTEKINFPAGFKIDLSNWNPDKEAHAKLKQLADENGFELKEKKWLGRFSKHKFSHKESGKVYEWKPGQLFIQGFPKDLRSDLDHFNRLKQLAEDNGFELKEIKWLGNSTKHRFLHKESDKVYEWFPNNLFSDGFPKDLRSDLDHFNRLKQLAEENGFVLKEMEWLGALTKHRFLHTESDRVYKGVPGKLFSRGFPKDLRSDRDHFNRLKQLAEDNGFELKEIKWLGSITKHRFLHTESEKFYEGFYEGVPNKLFRQGFPKRLSTPSKQIQSDSGSASIASPKPDSSTTTLDQIASRLKALKADAGFSKGEKQDEIRVCTSELSAMVGPSMEPTAFDVEDDQGEDVVRERMAG